MPNQVRAALRDPTIAISIHGESILIARSIELKAAVNPEMPHDIPELSFRENLHSMSSIIDLAEEYYDTKMTRQVHILMLADAFCGFSGGLEGFQVRINLAGIQVWIVVPA